MHAAWSIRRRYEAASHEILERACGLDGGQPGDRPSTAGNHDLGTLLYPLQVLAEAIVKCPDAHFVVSCM
jgi:hypothetical protein